MQFIYSTHTNDVNYTEYYKDSPKNHNVIKKQITISGGHGMCNKNMITAEGVVTSVKDEDFEWLLTIPAFNRHVKKGFVRYQKRKEDPEKVVKRDMNPKDKSSPLTPKDYIIVDPTNHTYRSRNALKNTMSPV